MVCSVCCGGMALTAVVETRGVMLSNVVKTPGYFELK
jgi:hypothetical protein